MAENFDVYAIVVLGLGGLVVSWFWIFWVLVKRCPTCKRRGMDCRCGGEFRW